jgi:ubiquinone/menaquinone biosynthesis C-methylase UbiE
MPVKPAYSPEPEDQKEYTQKFDRFYTRFAPFYDRLVKWFPLWRNWLQKALPHLQGPRVLEISFGTGYLLTQYADHFEIYGIEYNKTMALTAQGNLEQVGLKANLQVGDVAALPYASGSFDTIVNTMAFTGYPDATQALSEMRRVLRPGGKLVMIDVNYPANSNWPGLLFTRAWAAGGDIIRDMGDLFQQFEFTFAETEIGGFGSIHLYIATRSSL